MPDTVHRPQRGFPRVTTPCPGAIAPVLRPGERVPPAIDRRLADLARQAQTGDVATRNTLYLALRPAMEPSLARLRHSEEWRGRAGRSWTWDDLAQETFPLFCTLLADWDAGSDGFAGCFFRLLGWRLRDTLRVWSAPERHASAGLRLRPLAAADDFEDAETRLLLERMLAPLPAADAAVARLRLADGLGDAAIADRLGAPLRTVRRRRVRAIAALRLALAGDAAGACYAPARTVEPNSGDAVPGRSMAIGAPSSAEGAPT